MIKIEKIRLEEISEKNYQVLVPAIEKYIDILSVLTDSENRSQQHIHLNIAHIFHFELLKKIMKREMPKCGVLKMEIYTAFVAYDALQNYTHYCTDEHLQACLRNMISELFSKLPYTAEKGELSIYSKLSKNE